MWHVELIIPSRDELCLRAAIKSGTDALYRGLNIFNARMLAENFNWNKIFVVNYCYGRYVKVYVTFNALKPEFEDYFKLINIVYSGWVDAIIIQNPCFIPLFRQNFPDLNIHLSTQATTTSCYTTPKDIDRMILAREPSYGEIKITSQKFPT
ncbi:MAG: peptidase U32 family protein [Candidatus Hadarchaeaceae archaeon]